MNSKNDEAVKRSSPRKQNSRPGQCFSKYCTLAYNNGAGCSPTSCQQLRHAIQYDLVDNRVKR